MFQRMKLRPQSRLDSRAGLVSRPQIVAKTLDDVIRRDREMCRAGFEQVQNRTQHALNRAEWSIATRRGAPGTEEMTEELVRSVDQVDDHSP